MLFTLNAIYILIAEAHIIAWNESDIIGMTIKHYQKFCDRVVLYDNFSTDNTRDIALALGADVRLFGIEGQLNDKEYLKVKNHCWKQSQANWVFIVDADEIVQVTREQLLNADGNIFNTYGWQVFSESFPRETFEEITTGFHDPNYSKLAVFKPSLEEIDYVYGCHVANPKGKIKFCSEVLPLFHYRNIGGYQRLSNRHALYRQRLSDLNKRWGLGIHYTYPEEQRRAEWYQQLEKSGEFVPHGT